MTPLRNHPVPGGAPDDASDAVPAALAARFRDAAPVLSADPAAIVARGRRRRAVTRGAAAALTVAAVAAVATTAVGLLGGAGGGTPPADVPPTPEPAGAVSLWLSATRVAPGDHDLVAVLVSEDGTEATFGVPASLERWDGSSWREVRRTNMCLDHWHCTARWYPPDATEVQGAEDIGLGVAAGSPGPVERFTVDGLEPGWYRVVQEAYGGVVARGVFEVAADAPEATPLWPVDSVAVSVQPPLVPADGGDVGLVPLVPPVDGTLDEGMLTGAMAGLSDRALVQRWGPEGWTEVGEVATSAPDAVSVPGELRTTLTALEPGAYRVLLRGDGKELMGSFWVPGEVPATTAPTPSSADRPSAECADDDVACLLDAWLVALLDEGRYGSEPAQIGEPPDDPFAARAVEVADSGGDLERFVGLLVTTLDGPDLGFDDLTVAQEWQGGDVLVEEGVTLDGDRAVARFTCGGFRFLVRGNLADERTRDRTWDLAEDVAARIDACPADVTGLAMLLGVADDDVPLGAPCDDMPAPLCAMDLWLVDSIEAAGYRHGGGDHDIGAIATDTVLVGDSTVGAAAWPLDADVAPGFETGRTTTVGDLAVEHWTADGHGPESRFTCGGYRLAFSISTDVADAGSADVVAGVAEAVAAVIGPCPGNEDALVAQYADVIHGTR